MLRAADPQVPAQRPANTAPDVKSDEQPAGSAPTASLPALPLEEAVQLAVRNNPRVLAASRDVSAATSGVRSARALANPSAFVAPGITSISGVGEEFLLQQPLEINGTRSARTGVAQAELRGAAAQSVVALRDVVFAVRSAYFELARAREQAGVARDALEVAREFDLIARRQVEEGARPGIELAQTGLEVARAEREVTLAEGRATAALATLNTSLGRDPATPVGSLEPLTSHPLDVTVPQSTPAPTAGGISPTAPSAPAVTQPPVPEPSTAALLSQALASRAEIQTEAATGERLRQEARLARAEGRPDLVPQLRVGYFTRGLQPASSGNGAGIGLALTLPVLDYGSRQNRIRQLEQSAQAQDARTTAVRNEVREQVTAALARQTSAEAVVRSYQGGVLDQARRLLEGSRIGFQEGRTNIVSLLEAQRSFRAVQSEYVNALADAAIARAELERATGAVPASLLPSAGH